MGKHSAGGGRQSRDNDISSTLGGGRSGQGRRRRGTVPDPAAVPAQAQVPSARYDGGYAGGYPDARPHPEHREHAAWGAADAWAAEAARGHGAGARPGELADPYDTGSHGTDPYDTGQWQTFDQPVLPQHSYAADPQPFETPPGRRIPGPRVPEPVMDSALPEVTADDADTEKKSGGKGRTFTGIAAAAVVTVLAVVVAGQVSSSGAAHSEAGASGGATRDSDDAASRSKERPTPGVAPSNAPAVTVAGYDELMARQYPLDPRLSLGGQFQTMPGHDPAPGKGKLLRFRVDVEKGLPLDAALFTQTVFKTLNDDRSWGHGGTKTFERVSSGPVDIVVTLASPGTTAKWCGKSGLDTTVDNVSCDSASTERTMINAFRWAQGADTFGPARMHEYRQMLINHEVGHRLGHGHVGCPSAGALAPVMMQQTKFLSLDGGPTCKPNAWPFPNA